MNEAISSLGEAEAEKNGDSPSWGLGEDVFSSSFLFIAFDLFFFKGENIGLPKKTGFDPGFFDVSC